MLLGLWLLLVVVVEADGVLPRLCCDRESGRGACERGVGLWRMEMGGAAYVDDVEGLLKWVGGCG